MDNIILIGAGGHARSCIDVIESTGKYQIAGLVEKANTKTIGDFGYSLIGTDDDLPELRNKYKKALITVGQIESAGTRMKLFNLISDLNFQIPVVVSPRAHVGRLLPEELKAMVKAIRNIEQAIGDGIKKPSKSEQKNIPFARKSIVAKRPIKKGEFFTDENLTVKRPATGISPMKWDEILGKVSPRKYKDDEVIVI